MRWMHRITWLSRCGHNNTDTNLFFKIRLLFYTLGQHTKGSTRTRCTRRQDPGGSCARVRACSMTIAVFSLSAPEPWHTELTAARSCSARRPVEGSEAEFRVVSILFPALEPWHTELSAARSCYARRPAGSKCGLCSTA